MSRLPLLFFLLLPILSFSNHPKDSIDFSKLDIEYLEQLVKQRIDSIREANGLYALKFKFPLNKAAEDHAMYLMLRQEASHHQKFYKKRNVLQRVHFFGASNVQKAGENVLVKHPRRKYVWDEKRDRYNAHFYYTYASLSRSIVKAWMDSPSHRQNLLTPDYHYTAVAIAFDNRKKDLTCVQVFASYISGNRNVADNH